MRALSRSCGNGIPASRQAGGSEAEYRSAVSRCYSRTSRARCAGSTRSRSADRHSRVRNEAVDAHRSIDANASPAMGGKDVTEETRSGVAYNRGFERLLTRLKMKPIVLAREHGPVYENLRQSGKCHDAGDNDDWSDRADSPQEVPDSIGIQQGKRNQRAAHQAA